MRRLYYEGFGKAGEGMPMLSSVYDLKIGGPAD